MNKVLIILIFLLLIIYNLNSKIDNFSVTQPTPTCNSNIDESTGEFNCGQNNCCLNSTTCNITDETEESDDGNSVGFNPYNIVIDPNKEVCIDFCVNTYTNTSKDDISFGRFKDNSKISAFFSSKCNECINNHYNRLNTIFQSSDSSNNGRCTQPS